MRKIVVTLIGVMVAAFSLFAVGCGQKTNSGDSTESLELVKVDAKDATCENDGNIEYWKDKVTDKYYKDAEGKTEITDKATVVIDALGHNYDTENIVWAWTDYTSATATFVCKNDETHKEVVNAVITNEVTVAPTCTTKGTKVYTATVTFNEVEYTNTKEEVLEIVAHEITHQEAKEPTCDVDGNIEYWECAKCGKYFSDAEGKTEITDKTSVVKAKTGHNYDTENITWAWTDYTSATATFVCKNDTTHKEVVNAVITNEVTVAPTCTTKGTKVYTATATFNDVEYTNTKEEVLNEIGHNYDTENIVWTWTDYTSATATFVCKNDATHKEVVNAVITNEVTVDPTCTAEGTKVYTATATFNGVEYTNTKEEVLGILAHTLTHHTKIDATCEQKGNIEYWTCDVCNKVFKDKEGLHEITMSETVIEKLPHNFVDGICSVCHKSVYEMSPFTLTSEKMTYAGRSAEYRYVYEFADGVIQENVAPTFDMTMEKEVVNELMRIGHKNITLVLGRKTNNTASKIYIDGKSTNGYHEIPVTLTANTPVVIKNVRVVALTDWKDWVPADGFSVRYKNLDFIESQPGTWIDITEYDFTYNETDGYVIKDAPKEKNIYFSFNKGMIKYFKEKALTDPTYTILCIKTKPLGGYHAVSGVDLDSAAGSAFDWDFTGSYSVEIATLPDVIDSTAIYYGTASEGTPAGISFKITHTLGITDNPEAWFKSFVDCKKVNNNTFDFTYNKDQDVKIFEMNEQAKQALIDKGYTKIKITYQNKDNEKTNVAISSSHDMIGFSNGGTGNKEFNIKDMSVIHSYYAAYDGGPATGARLTFEAIK